MEHYKQLNKELVEQMQILKLENAAYRREINLLREQLLEEHKKKVVEKESTVQLLANTFRSALKIIQPDMRASKLFSENQKSLEETATSETNSVCSGRRSTDILKELRQSSSMQQRRSIVAVSPVQKRSSQIHRASTEKRDSEGRCSEKDDESTSRNLDSSANEELENENTGAEDMELEEIQKTNSPSNRTLIDMQLNVITENDESMSSSSKLSNGSATDSSRVEVRRGRESNYNESMPLCTSIIQERCSINISLTNNEKSQCTDVEDESTCQTINSSCADDDDDENFTDEEEMAVEGNDKTICLRNRIVTGKKADVSAGKDKSMSTFCNLSSSSTTDSPKIVVRRGKENRYNDSIPAPRLLLSSNFNETERESTLTKKMNMDMLTVSDNKFCSLPTTPNLVDLTIRNFENAHCSTPCRLSKGNGSTTEPNKRRSLRLTAQSPSNASNINSTATTFDCTNSVGRPRRKCTPSAFKEASLKDKMRDENRTAKKRHGKKGKK